MIGLLPYRMVTVSEIIAAPFNPTDRTEEKALEELEARVRELDGIYQPLLISKDMRLIDGHRRLEVAKRLKYKEVPCLITSLGLQAGWAGMNVSSMPIKGRQYVYAVAHGLDEAYLPQDQRRKVKRLRELTGERFIEIADAGLSTTVLDIVYRIGAITGDKSDEWMRRVLFWVVRHKMQNPARKAIEQAIKIDAIPTVSDILRRAVNRNVPLTEGLGWSVADNADDDESDE